MPAPDIPEEFPEYVFGVLFREMPAFRGLESTNPAVDRFEVIRVKQIFLHIARVRVNSMIVIIRVAYYTGPDCKLFLAFLLRLILVKYHAQYIGTRSCQ